MSEVYAYRKNGKLVAIGTALEIAQMTGMTKGQVLRRTRKDSDDDDLVVDVSPNRRDKRSTKARDLTCSDLRDKGLDTVQIQRVMGMSKAMVTAALARVDGGRYADTFIEEEQVDDMSAYVAVSSLSPKKRIELAYMIQAAEERGDGPFMVP